MNINRPRSRFEGKRERNENIEREEWMNENEKKNSS